MSGLFLGLLSVLMGVPVFAIEINVDHVANKTGVYEQVSSDTVVSTGTCTVGNELEYPKMITMIANVEDDLLHFCMKMPY